MIDYTFVCIGTNKLITDSFGPRVGEKLKSSFKNEPRVQVFGTMKKPVHFKNAKKLINQLNTNSKIVLIDSALATKAPIGEIYMGLGGMEIGKAYGKSFYFPADMHIKTVIGNTKRLPNWEIEQMEFLAQSVARKITSIVWQV